MDKEEFKRLERAKQKADKKKSQQPLYDWAIQLERQLSDKTKKFYEDLFDKKMKQSIEWYQIAMSYTLHFNEKCNFGQEILQDIMNDLEATVELFGNREYTAEDYLQQLKDDGIILRNLDKLKEEK